MPDGCIRKREPVSKRNNLLILAQGHQSGSYALQKNDKQEKNPQPQARRHQPSG